MSLGPLGGTRGVKISLLREIIAESRAQSENAGISEGEFQGTVMIIEILEKRLSAMVDEAEREFREILARSNRSR